MPHLTAPLTANGPIVLLAVMVSQQREAAMRVAKMPIPQPAIGPALIDTGASCTSVDTSVIAQLGIPPTGSVPIVTPSTGNTPHLCRQFDVGIGIFLGPNQAHFRVTLPVLECDLSKQGIKALIGRDVLGEALMVYNGKAATVTLSF